MRKVIAVLILIGLGGALLIINPSIYNKKKMTTKPVNYMIPILQKKKFWNLPKQTRVFLILVWNHFRERQIK